MFNRRQAIGSLSSVLAVPAVTVSALSHSAQAQDSTFSDPLPVQFDSQGVLLAGELFMPEIAPIGAVVLVHGSGRAPNMREWAHFFSRTGLAVLSYDKRGLGRSGGTYEENHNTSPENLALLSADAASAMKTLRGRPELVGLKIGYFGVSQAGWVVPLALSSVGLADYFVLWSGPLCTVAEEMEAGIGKGGNRSDDATARKEVDQMRTNGRDTDPRDSLWEIQIPGLWIFGAADETIPVELSIARLKGLIGRGRSNFGYWLNSEGRHFDLRNEMPIFSGMLQWIGERVRQA